MTVVAPLVPEAPPIAVRLAELPHAPLPTVVDGIDGLALLCLADARGSSLPDGDTLCELTAEFVDAVERDRVEHPTTPRLTYREAVLVEGPAGRQLITRQEYATDHVAVTARLGGRLDLVTWGEALLAYLLTGHVTP